MSGSNLPSELTINKSPDSLRDDIIGIRSIIESLEQEANKLENRRKQLATEIRHNDNILSVIYEDISNDNKEFLATLKKANNPSAPLIVSRNQAFVKRNFVKIKEGLEEKSINHDLGVLSRAQPVTEAKDGTTIRSVNETKSDRLQKIDSENFYMLLKLTRGEAYGLSSDIRAISVALRSESPPQKL